MHRLQQAAEVLPTHTPESFAAAVKRAADVLRRGGLVGLPTETVYGLAANALDAGAVAEIFSVKGRPARNPIIVHVATIDMARRCVAEWPPLAQKLADAFWPGPLTMVLPKSKLIPDIVCAGGKTVGVRWPRHPVIEAVIRECDFPLAAPSANQSSQLSPTTARHVVKSLGKKIPLILDGGPSHIGIESTVIDMSVSPPVLLRPGMIHDEALLAVTGELSRRSKHGTEVLKSPGLLDKHYSPQARLLILSWTDDADLRRKLKKAGCVAARTHIVAHTRVPAAEGLGRVSVIGHDPAAFARAIYGELHHSDDLAAENIVVEAFPEGKQWNAVADRLRRAAVR